MKPSKLQPGQQVRLNGRQMTFIRRDPFNRLVTLRCQAYVGLYGPKDLGDVVISDAKLARHGQALAEIVR